MKLKHWNPLSLNEIEKLSAPESTIEYEKLLFYSNGYVWAMGIKTSLTIKGRNSVYWKLGHWRAKKVKNS